MQLLHPAPVLLGRYILFGSQLLIRLKIDDVVGAIPVHLFAGIWGTIAVVISNPEASLGSQFLGIFAVPQSRAAIYTHTLNYTRIDGNSETLTGQITLLGEEFE